MFFLQRIYGGQHSGREAMTEIKNIDGEVIYTSKNPDDTIKQALHQALKARGNLQYADLQDANLRGADLGGINLKYANLSRADLFRANLRQACLRDAILEETNLACADLQGADLSGVNLRGTTITLGNTAFKLDKPEACDD